MITIYQCGWLSLAFLTSFTPAVAEPAPEPEKITPSAETKGNGASWRASEIIGTEVKNAGDEKIGEVEDLIIDLKSQEILGVVISTGGFLGVANTLSSVPATALRYDAGAKAFKTRLTKDELGMLPRHDAKTWAKNWSATRAALDEKLGGPPESSPEPGKTTTTAAGTGTDLTAMNQGSGEFDIKTTRDIRSALVDSKLSFSAKNIQIITREGKVTLKGMVNSDEEHQAVLELTDKHVGKSMLSDHLEVRKGKDN